MPERSHLSIGEVLSLLREEFPDVTISKIRFLESQGLVDPERTPSGYRKFYDHDVERLRWILRQQREHFLPLKVIRGRLTGHEGGELPDDEELPVGPSGQAEPSAEPSAEHPAEAVERAAAAGTRADLPARAGRAPVAEETRSTAGRPAPAARRAETGPTVNGPTRTAPPTPSLFAELHARTQAATEPGLQEPSPAGPPPGPPAPPAPAPTPAAPRAVTAPPSPPEPSKYEAEDSDTYTAEELAGAAGVETSVVHDLKQYGLIAPHAVVAGVPYYDGAALAVARAAAGFARHGVEARHLRMWRNAADREADLFQQVVLPMLRQRNPQARRQALDTLAELSAAGAALRAALVERAVRDIR